MTTEQGPPSWEVYEARLDAKDPHGISLESKEVFEGINLGRSLGTARKLGRKYGFLLPQWFEDRFLPRNRLGQGRFKQHLKGQRNALKGNTGKSWNKSFARSIEKQKFVKSLHAHPHAQYGWAHAMGLPELAPELTSHAPWLNGQALGMRQGLHPEIKWHYQ